MIIQNIEHRDSFKLPFFMFLFLFKVTKMSLKALKLPVKFTMV